MQPYYYSNNPMANAGQAPNDIQNPASIYPPGVNGETYTPDSFKAWCAPTSAACQLGHLNLQNPPEIFDGFNANEKPIALSTLNWDSGRGWGDYLLDGPSHRLQIGNNTNTGLPSDIGFYMDTNNVGVGGNTANSAVGTKLANIYSGLNKFYSEFGYSNMVGCLYVNSQQAPFSDGILAEYYLNNGITANVVNVGVNGDSGNIFNTIKHEIDNNRTVLASFKYWGLNQLQLITLDNAINSEQEFIYYELTNPLTNNEITGENYFYDNDGHTNSLGHTVIVVGYIEANTINDINNGTNWLVLRDNQENTARNVVLNYTTAFSTLIGLTFVNPTLTTFQPPNQPKQFNITVTASGFSSYQLVGEDRSGAINGEDPTININLGDTLSMIINSLEHPLWIKSLQVTGIDNGIPEVTNNGAAGNQELNWTPNLIGTYYYICQHHASMSGEIIVN